MAGRIEGYVDSSTFSPMVSIKLVSSEDEEVESPAIVDTGYNGEVILPENKIQEMGLEFLGTIDSELANGQIVEIELFRGRLKWFDMMREVTIGATQSDEALLGTQLLSDCELRVDFKQGKLTIDQLNY